MDGSSTHPAHASPILPSPSVTVRAEAQVSPRPMTFIDVPAAVDTYTAAFMNDPFHRWLRDTPDHDGGIVPACSRRAEIYVIWNYFVSKSRAWTVDDGAAVVCYGPARSTLSRASRAYAAIVGGALGLKTRLTLTAQQRKRSEEFKGKHKAAFKEALGDREEEVMHLEVLATHPDKQGRGYASALVKTVTAIADAQGRTTVLTSSNPINTGFYDSLGFVEKAQIVVGEDDPTWQGPPLTVLVMLREPVISSGQMGDSSS